jgi:hypothetical protein
MYNQASKHRKTIQSGPMPVFWDHQQAKQPGDLGYDWRRFLL